MKIIYGILIIILAQSVAAGNLCNTSIEIFTKKQFYENESIDFQFGLSTKPPEYVIEYWVEDIYDNIVKKKRNTTNLNKKSYSPHVSGVQAFVIMARFLEIDCLRNVMFEKTVLYKGEIQSENQCCACTTKKRSGIYY